MTVYSLSLSQQVGQLLVAGFQGPEVNDTARTLVNEIGVGHIILYRDNVQTPIQVRQLCDELSSLSKETCPFPVNICADQEGQPVLRLVGGPKEGPAFTPFPSSRSVANANDLSLAEALERVFKVTFRRVFGLFWPIWGAKRGGNITLRILPPRFASQIGSKEPKNRPKFILKTRS